MATRRGPLEWIVLNRQPRSRAVRIGQCLGDHAGALAERTAIRRAVGAFVDEEFRRGCTLGPVDAQRVVILAASPAEAHALRLRWLTTLREHLARTCKGFGARQLMFRVGRGDDLFPGPAEPEPRQVEQHSAENARGPVGDAAFGVRI
jgi:hypothetical protein